MKMKQDLAPPHAVIESKSRSKGPVNIGPRLKELRAKRGWTLSDAAKRTGVAQSTLSKVERGELSPSLNTLQKIANGMGIDLVTLIAPGDAEPPRGRRSIYRGETTEPLTWIANEIANKKMFPFFASITARDPDDYPEWMKNPGGEKFAYVLKGTLVIYSEFYEPLTLEAGHGVYFDATMGTKWVSKSERAADVLWVYVP